MWIIWCDGSWFVGDNLLLALWSAHRETLSRRIIALFLKCYSNIILDILTFSINMNAWKNSSSPQKCIFYQPLILFLYVGSRSLRQPCKWKLFSNGTNTITFFLYHEVRITNCLPPISATVGHFHACDWLIWSFDCFGCRSFLYETSNIQTWAVKERRRRRRRERIPFSKHRFMAC